MLYGFLFRQVHKAEKSAGSKSKNGGNFDLEPTVDTFN